MKVQKEIIILGDIEMGAGNLTDDFISDRSLSELILELKERPHPVDLILNGDTFDFLKCPIFEKNRLIYPRHITEEVSLKKLNLIHYAHYRVFNALRKFLRSSHHHLYFIIGNHDIDLKYPLLRKKLRRFLRARKNVHFSLKYHRHDVYVEHGHQYDLLNRMPYQNLFLNYKGRSILNLPFVYFGLISRFMSIKEDHPFMERITNRHLLLGYHRPFLRELTFKALIYYFKSIFYYPFRYYSDPTYTLPKGLIRHIFTRIKKVQWDIDKIVHIFRKKSIFKKYRIHVLGHIHEKYIEDKGGHVLIHPGSWRDEYELNKDTNQLIPIEKRYVQILITEQGPQYQLINYPIKRSRFDFEQVLKHEYHYLKLAAKEEKYTPPLI